MSAFRLAVLLIVLTWLGCGSALAEKRVARRDGFVLLLATLVTRPTAIFA
jgi:hypothetical protein